MDIFIIKIINSDNVHRELLQGFQKREISDPKRWNSHCLSYLMIDRILRDFYHIEDREIIFDGNKPILKSDKKHFSLSHSGEFIALAFSDYNCGIDIEEIKLRDFNNIAKRMGFNAKNMGNCAEITFGPSKGEKVYIAGHVDIVPPGDGWTSPPYELTIRDGKIVGDEDNRNDMAGAENVKGSDLGDRLDLKSAQL